jgi:integrase
MLLKIEQGKGRTDRFAMLSPVLLEVLRDWYRIARPTVWLFPGRDRLLPLTTRQFTAPFMPPPIWPRSTTTVDSKGNPRSVGNYMARAIELVRKRVR